MRRLEDALRQVELKGKRREGMKAKIKGCVSLSLFLCFLLFVCHHLGQRVFERNTVGRTVHFGGEVALAFEKRRAPALNLLWKDVPSDSSGY